MAMVVDLTKYFTALKITKRFTVMPPIQSTIFDRHFPESERQQYESPIIPVQEITQAVQTVPVVHRGAESVPMVGDASETAYIEPLPVRIHTMVSAKELNDLRLMGEESRETWAARRQERLRQTVRKTVEALAAQAVFNGEIAYPLLQSNGQFATYKVAYPGQTQRTVDVAANSKWNSAECTLVKIHKLLRDMAKGLDNAGFGGNKTTYAGSDAMDALLTLIEGTDKPKIPVKVADDGSVKLGGFTITEMNETWRNPQDGSTVNKLAPGETRMVSAGYTGFFYGAVDDLDAKLQALPMFVKPIVKQNPSGYLLVAESKPLPAVAPGSACKAVVIA